MLEVVEAVVERGVPRSRVAIAEVSWDRSLDIDFRGLMHGHPAGLRIVMSAYALGIVDVTAVHAVFDPPDERPPLREHATRLNRRVRGRDLDVRPERLLLHLRVVAAEPTD